MHGRVHDLTREGLDDLPAACRRCVFWESQRAPRGPSDEPSARDAKEAWFQATQLEWGTPGKAVYDGGTMIGYALFAPGHHFPRVRTLHTTVSEDAFLLSTLWVAESHRGGGIARALVHTVLRETHARGGKALEAYASTIDDGRPWACVLSAGFLEAIGFQLHQADPRFPLYRLDLRRTARWQEAVEHALEGVVAALGRRERARRPALESRRSGTV